MAVEKQLFGKTADGTPVDLYTLTNLRGLRVKIMTFGATITAVETPDRTGKIENINICLDSLGAYLKGHPSLGSTIGRYANRIAKGRFSLDGVEYRLATNLGENHLHGGVVGFNKVVWQAVEVESPGSSGVAFSYKSADGEEGYPGNLSVAVTYSLTDADELKMVYAATTDRRTVLNLTNHAYWNLSGATSGSVLNHELTINADNYVVVREGSIPTGEIRGVKGTPLDFTRMKTIGRDIENAGGYDNCYVLNKKPGEKLSGSPKTTSCFAGGNRPHPLPLSHRERGVVVGEKLSFAARAFDPRSGRAMEVFSTEPSVQLYTANGFDGSLSGGGHAYQKYDAFCLEAQHFPDSPNHPNFPSTVLGPGERYEQVTVHKFSAE